jgi:TRAP-type C4-dicarboxylate transport system permease small subunit
MPIDLPFFLKYIALTVIAWIAVLSFIQDGLKQVETAQTQHRTGEAS